MPPQERRLHAALGSIGADVAAERGEGQVEFSHGSSSSFGPRSAPGSARESFHFHVRGG